MVKMNKKVLVISANSKISDNSEILCEQFISGVAKGGNLTEKIFIKDKKINYCIGCNYCKTRDGKCIHKDDMSEILEKMAAADAIVMVAPVSSYNLEGQMKTLIGRTVARHEEINSKKIYFIFTQTDNKDQSLETTVDSFIGFVAGFKEMKTKGVTYGIVAYCTGETKGNLAIKEAYEMGKNI